VEKKSLVVSDARALVASASMKVPYPPHFSPQLLQYPSLTTLFHYLRTQYGESVALLPTISSTPQRPLAADWMLISGARLSRRFAGVNLLCGMP
jgi:hypothetical protein